MRERPLVLGIDGSPGSATAVRWAGEEAARAGLPLVVVGGCTTALSDTTALSGALTPGAWVVGDAVREAARRSVQEALTRISTDHPDVHASGRVLRGNMYEAMLALARRAEAVVIGAMDSRLRARTGLWNTPLAKRSPAPVVITPTEPAGGPATEIVVGVSAEARAHRVFAFAFEHGRRHRAALRIVCRLPGRRASFYETECWLFDALSSWRAEYPDVRIASSVVAAASTSQLIVEAERARLVVIDGPGHRSGDWTVRRRTRRLLRWTRRPVAVVPTTQA